MIYVVIHRRMEIIGTVRIFRLVRLLGLEAGFAEANSFGDGGFS